MHYKSDHFICTYQVCLDKKFVVFRSDMDLKAHELSEHGKGQGKRGVQVEIDLTYNTQRQSAASDRQSMEEGQGEFISHRNHHRAIERNIDLTQSKGEIDKTDTSISSRKTNKTKSNQGNASLSTLHQSPSTSIEGIHPERLNISGHKTTREAFNTSQDINTQQYPQLSNSTRSLRVPLNFGSTLSDINTSNSGESIKKSIPSTSILKENKFKSKRETTSSIILNPPGLSHPLLPTSISITTDASLNELINVHFDSNSKKIEQFDSLFKSYSSELITSQEFLDGLVSMSNKDVQRVWIRLSAFIGGLNERDMLSAWNDLKVKV